MDNKNIESNIMKFIEQYETPINDLYQLNTSEFKESHLFFDKLKSLINKKQEKETINFVLSKCFSLFHDYNIKKINIQCCNYEDDSNASFHFDTQFNCDKPTNEVLNILSQLNSFNNIFIYDFFNKHIDDDGSYDKEYRIVYSQNFNKSDMNKIINKYDEQLFANLNKFFLNKKIWQSNKHQKKII